jgi:hypothetical protein
VKNGRNHKKHKKKGEKKGRKKGTVNDPIDLKCNGREPPFF